MYEVTYDIFFNTVPAAVAVSKVLISILIVAFATGTSYFLLLVVLWYHLLVPRIYEIIMVYTGITLFLTMWYLVFKFFKKYWKRRR